MDGCRKGGDMESPFLALQQSVQDPRFSYQVLVSLPFVLLSCWKGDSLTAPWTAKRKEGCFRNPLFGRNFRLEDRGLEPLTS